MPTSNPEKTSSASFNLTVNGRLILEGHVDKTVVDTNDLRMKPCIHDVGIEDSNLNAKIMLDYLGTVIIGLVPLILQQRKDLPPEMVKDDVYGMLMTAVETAMEVELKTGVDPRLLAMEKPKKGEIH